MSAAATDPPDKGWATWELGTLVAVVLGSAMVFLDSTIVNVALPRIGEELRSSVFGVLEAQSYVYTVYLLTLSALLILGGALGDVFGRRRVFTIGLVGFGVTSALCGVAPTMELLIVFRVLQGAAGALLVPGSLAIINACFDGERRGRAFGIWASATTATTILGPFLGGILVDTISWRAAFLINVPLAAVALWVTARWAVESRDEEATRRFDWVGSLVVVVAVGGLALGAIRGQERQWADPAAFVALGVGAVAVAALPWLMRRSPHPLVPPNLFRSRNFTVANVATLLIYGAIYVALYFLIIYIQGTVGYTAAAAGFAAVPGMLLLAIGSSRFGALAGRHGPRRFMAAGPGIMAIGILWLVRMPADSAAWALDAADPATWLPSRGYLVDVLPAIVLLGVGLMVMVAPLTTAVMTSVPSRHSGVASAVNNAISRVGPQLAGALVFVFVTATFYGALADRVPDLDITSPTVRADVPPLNRTAADVPEEVVAAATASSTEAFRLAMGIAAVLFVAGAVVNAVGMRDPAPEMQPPPVEHAPVPAATPPPAALPPPAT